MERNTLSAQSAARPKGTVAPALPGMDHGMPDGYKIITDDDRIYSMGITVMENRIHVATANAGETCSLVLFEKQGEEPCCVIPMSREQQMGNVWNLTLERHFPVRQVTGNADVRKMVEMAGLEYCFEVDGKLVPDPYGCSFRGWEHWGKLSNVQETLRSPVCQPDFDWEGDKPLCLPFEDSIIYRIHTRGFTKHVSSKVPDKGTFKAIIDKIPYMKELGVTTVELMPVMEFQEIMVPEGVDGNPYGITEPTGKINYWGYTGGYYFAPKTSYSSGRVKAPVVEFKQLVKELHRAGMELVVELYFNGKEKPAFALDVVRYWVREYHLDGIHLVGYAPEELIGRDEYLSRTKLFATSWEGIDGGKYRHLAEYNDGFLVDMRRLLKGDEDQMNNLIFRTRQNPARCGIVNYMAHTNGFTMTDMVSYDIKHNEANGENNLDGNSYNYSWNCGVEGPTRKKKLVELRRKQIKNAILMVMLSQGTPLLLAGDEFGNSKSGNNNTYCQDNELSWLNWNQLKTNHDLYEFVRQAIAFRKRHSVFHMDREPQVMDYKACGCPDISYHGVNTWCPEFENFRRQMGILYCGEYGRKPDGTADDYFFVVYNMHWESHEFSLPNLPKSGTWYLAVNTNDTSSGGIYREGEELVLEDQKQYEAPARTILVFMGKCLTEDAGKKKSRKKRRKSDIKTI